MGVWVNIRRKMRDAIAGNQEVAENMVEGWFGLRESGGAVAAGKHCRPGNAMKRSSYQAPHSPAHLEKPCEEI